MNDAQLKWANCCNVSSACFDCAQYKGCAQWYRYVDKHRRSKKYAHFDNRTSLACNSTRSKVMNPTWISQHAFWPLIEFEKSKNRFVGAKSGAPAHLVKKNPRIIRYCAHIDRCVYQRYSFLLDQKYNKASVDKGIDDVAVAYRTNKSLNNLHFAKRVLDFIENTNECLIIVSDFDSFFDRIDHEILKKSLCKLIGTNNLPDDYYAVFKNTVGYSSWSWNSIMEYWRDVDPSISRRMINSKETVLPRRVFRALGKREIRRNWSNVGIPQGSPISAVLSNIYMMDFDEKIQSFIKKNNGLYMRYCDDLLIVLPEIGFNTEKAFIEEVIFKIGNQPGIEIQHEKTAVMKYRKTLQGASLKLIDSEKHRFLQDTVLDYLGVTFDGTVRKIRPKAISKYYYRLYRKASTIAQQNKGRRNIYGIYSDRSKSISGRRSFIDYAKDADRILHTSDPEADSIVSHNMEKIAKAINRKSEINNKLSG